jgi:hypothetical protein
MKDPSRVDSIPFIKEEEENLTIGLKFPEMRISGVKLNAIALRNNVEYSREYNSIIVKSETEKKCQRTDDHICSINLQKGEANYTFLDLIPGTYYNISVKTFFLDYQNNELDSIISYDGGCTS